MLSVTLLITVDLRGPILLIRLWYVAALRTAMPKTAINKYRDSQSWENEIRSPNNFPWMQLPALAFTPNKHRAQAPFSRTVSA
jgi:hypothetical protein